MSGLVSGITASNSGRVGLVGQALHPEDDLHLDRRRARRAPRRRTSAGTTVWLHVGQSKVMWATTRGGWPSPGSP